MNDNVTPNNDNDVYIYIYKYNLIYTECIFKKLSS